MTLDCDVCNLPFKSKKQPFCASCLKAVLYFPRVEQAAALLSRERAHTQVEAIARPGNDGVLAALPEDVDLDAIQTGIKSHSHKEMKVAKEAADFHIAIITAKAEELKQQIEQYKKSVAAQREENARRKDALTTKRAEQQKQHAQLMEPVHVAVRKARHRLNKVHDRTAEAREYICRAATSLSGLRKVRGPDNRSLYWLGGLPIPDLRDINGNNGRMKLDSRESSPGPKRIVEPHELISASLDNVCRFVGLCCHYLSIRLPGEIVLPHNDLPHAAILPIDSSYRSREIKLPRSSTSQSPTPEASRLLSKSELSRPRLLQLDRPFPQLQKEDPKAAAFFREGVVLLAYDIAWLCRSQGINTVTVFDSVCELGRNLYDLLPRQDGKSRPSLQRNLTSATGKTESPTSAVPDAQPRLGSHSHGSVRHSLAGYEGGALFGANSTWDLSVLRLTDQLKSYLRRESQRAEWDIIEQTEWDEELEEERPVFVGGARRRSVDAKGAAMSVMTVKPSDDEALPYHDVGPSKANAGWMKIRGRGGQI